MIFIEKRDKIDDIKATFNIAASVDESVHDIAIDFINDLVNGDPNLTSWFEKKYQRKDNFYNYVKTLGILEKVLEIFYNHEFTIQFLERYKIKDIDCLDNAENKLTAEEKADIKSLFEIYNNWITNIKPDYNVSLYDTYKELESRCYELGDW